LLNAGRRENGMSEAVATEQREFPRLAPTILRADVERDGARSQGYLMNVSLGGAFLAVEQPPAPDSEVTVHVMLPWGMGDCRLEARSVWLQKDEHERAIGAGISFVDLSEETKSKLRRCLDRFVELAADITG
jgi:PilZ domain